MAEMWDFLSRNAAYFYIKENLPQEENFPYVYTFFSGPSQHVMGDCLAECIDKAMSHPDDEESA